MCCEDDERELWRRLDLIAQHYNVTFTEFGDMHLMALAGQETLMAVPDRHGLIQPTKLFARISQAARDIRPKLIVLDNAADIYGGNENDRAQVRQFIGFLRGLAIASGAGVLLTSHPSLTGISTGTGLSGSTAWNASVRSRLYFKRAVTDKDEEPDLDLRVLEVMKSNYGPVGETIQLRWKNGLFLPVAGISNLEKLAAEQAAAQLFLEILNEFNRQGRNTSAKPAAPTYAPTLFTKEKKARERSIKKAAFEGAMRDLFAADKIGLEPTGRNAGTHGDWRQNETCRTPCRTPVGPLSNPPVSHTPLYPLGVHHRGATPSGGSSVPRQLPEERKQRGSALAPPTQPGGKP